MTNITLSPVSQKQTKAPPFPLPVFCRISSSASGQVPKRRNFNMLTFLFLSSGLLRNLGTQIREVWKGKAHTQRGLFATSHSDHKDKNISLLPSFSLPYSHLPIIQLLVLGCLP